MRHRAGIVTLATAVVAGIAVGLAWMLAHLRGSAPLLSRHDAWVVGGLVCGLAWLALEYGRDRRRALRSRLRQLRQIDWGGS